MSDSGVKDNAEWCVLTFSAFWSSYRIFASVINSQIYPYAQLNSEITICDDCYYEHREDIHTINYYFWTFVSLEKYFRWNQLL